MRSALIAASSFLALGSVTLAPVASAQVQACEQHNNQTAGTVVGAIGGAILGNAVAGHGDKKTGAIVGALGGALIGNQIGKNSGKVDCNHAYGFYDNDGRWHANPVNRDVAAGYYDRNGRWSDGAPNGYYDNRGTWVSATSDMRQGYYDNSGRWVPPQVDGYYDPNNRWVAVSAPPPARYADNGDYWRDAPRDSRERTDWLRTRIQRAEDDRRLSHREASNLLDDLRDIQVRESRLPHRNGGLNYQDEQVIQAQLDDLNRDFHQDMRG
ncbi:MAG TPA: glycine zipper 2TM domain-containing protein [Hyphomonadaceae bacterium]|jgi:hypothetical protein|nr:glycine zipper 2TM domain-containing protein [Hyphomonadaceae bacterium]